MGERLTIICNSFPPEKGGAPTRIYNMAALLRDHGFDITVVCAMPNYPTGAIFPAYRGRFIVHEVLDGIRVRRLWLIPSNSGNIFIRGISIISQIGALCLLETPHLLFGRARRVIISSPPLLTGFCAVLLAHLAGKKIILNISDIWPQSATELGALRPGRLFRALQWMERCIYRYSTAFTGQSSEILDHIRELSPGSKPAFLYRNLQPAVNPAGDSVSYNSRKIIYAGILGVAQGMLELCRHIDFAAAGASLHIYGDGVERDAIKAFTAQHPERGIFLHPTVPNAEISRLLEGFGAVLIPLKTGIRGAVPSKLFMGVANGLPVLFSGDGEGAALVREYGLGWVSPAGDYAALTRNISLFAGLSAPAYRQHCLKVREAASGIFDKSAQDAAFLHFLEHLDHPGDKHAS